MQSIERYGVVALLFLVVTVVAVLVWDTGSSEEPTAVARAGDRAAPIEARPRGESPAAEEAASGRARLRVKPTSRPLTRDSEPGAGGPQVQTAEEPAGLRPGRGASQDAETPAANRRPRQRPRRESQETVAPPASREAAARTQDRAPASGAAGGHGTHAYVVRGGDTLSEISQRELGTYRRWQEIVALNPGLDPDRLVVGREIRLPGGAASAPVPAAAPRRTERAATERAPADGPVYVVSGGDSLWRIAERRLGDGERWKEIARLNPDLDPDHLIVGRELVLPAEAAAEAGPVVAAGPGSETRGRVR